MAFRTKGRQLPRWVEWITVALTVVWLVNATLAAGSDRVLQPFGVLARVSMGALGVWLAVVAAMWLARRD